MAYDEPNLRRRMEEPVGEDEPVAYRGNVNGLAAAYRGRRRDAVEDGDPWQADDPDRAAGLDRPADPYRSANSDRLGIHLGWEMLLLLGVAALGFLLYRIDPATLRRPALDTLLVSATVIGLLALGAGLSLRAGVPNLAVGPIAVASALHFAENGDRGVLSAVAPAVAVAAMGALAVSLLILGLHVPGWAATLAAAMGVIVFIQLRVRPVAVQGGFDPSDRAVIYFGGFALLAVLGGALGVITSLRRTLGRMRPSGDPARRPGGAAVVPAIGALVASSAFAVAAGVLMAADAPGPVAPTTGLEWTGIAVGVALVAGTSAFGRRGGIFGTLLAAVAMALFLDYARRRDFDIALFATAATTVAAGLVITRLVERYGRPDPVAEQPDSDWQGDPGVSAPAWSPASPQSWTAATGTSDRADGWDGGSRWDSPAR